MKIITVSILIVSSILFLHCNSTKQLSGTFQAKLAGGICGHHIIEIMDSSFYKLGTNWKNSEGKEYKNAFTINNHCDFVKAQLKDGDVFTCEILDKATEENCMTCEAYMETPELKRNVRVVK